MNWICANGNNKNQCKHELFSNPDEEALLFKIKDDSS